jgi:hypothetical protein
VKRFAIPIASAGLVLLLAAGAVAAASPAPTAPATVAPAAAPGPADSFGSIADILGLTHTKPLS